MSPTPGTVPANISADLQTLANDLSAVTAAQANVASIALTLTGDQAGLATANTALAAAQATANTDLATLLADINTWDTGSSPAAAAFKHTLTTTLDRHKAHAATTGSGFNWGALIGDILPGLLTFLGGLLSGTPATGTNAPQFHGPHSDFLALPAAESIFTVTFGRGVPSAARVEFALPTPVPNGIYAWVPVSGSNGLPNVNLN